MKKAKWIIIVVVVILIVAAVTSGGGGSDTENNQVNETTTEPKELTKDSEKRDDKKEEKKSEENKKSDEFEYGDCKIKYKKHEIKKKDGDTLLIVYYDFTNNGDDPQEYDYFVTGTAYQDGAELETPFLHVNKESKNGEKKIKKGKTITVADSYILEDKKKNVNIEFRPFNVWSDELLMSLDLKIK